ncbi:MAG: hypothetical protein HRU28_02215 [Rhizobiales bacterium]|nr:hypothetical protein [Hyphomicrobiales bacterium]
MKRSICLKLLAIVSSSILLFGCSSSTGDFGRLNTSSLGHITSVQAKIIDPKTGIYYKNPIQYSKIEQKFRLSAFLLKQIDHDISLIDKLALINKTTFPAGTTPIDGKSLVNAFNAKGIVDIKDRYQNISVDIQTRQINLIKFHKLALKVIAQDSKRNILENLATDKKHIIAIDERRAENLAQIRDIVSYMKILTAAYNYVIDHGKIVEPNISQRDIRIKLNQFHNHATNLQSLLNRSRFN